VAETVARLPEQSFDRVSRAMPAKPPRYCFLGAPNLRQEIALEPQGDIVLHADSLRSGRMRMRVPGAGGRRCVISLGRANIPSWVPGIGAG
jgi:hypothetical protein